VCKRVIADLVAFIVFALQPDPAPGCCFTDDEENARDIFLFEDIQDFRCPPPVGAVIERDHQFLLGAAKFLRCQRERYGLVFFPGEEIRGGIVVETPHAVFGHIRPMCQISPSPSRMRSGPGGMSQSLLRIASFGVRGIPDRPRWKNRQGTREKTGQFSSPFFFFF